MRIDGNCLCGHVTYEAEVDPESVTICHCTDCQTHSGTAYGVVVGVVDESFRLLSGGLKTYDKIADSGTVRALAFCPECGTRIHAKTVGEGSSFSDFAWAPCASAIACNPVDRFGAGPRRIGSAT